uniref:XRE family transcriptional regulator n=1 Tax=Fervidobacterium pennivorans TaxID=93466 RepID=A0A7C4VVE1_FERPE
MGCMETLFSKRRKELGLTQREIANKLGLTDGMIYHVEHLRSHLRAEHIYQYCKILQISLEDYFKEFEKRKGDTHE